MMPKGFWPVLEQGFCRDRTPSGAIGVKCCFTSPVETKINLFYSCWKGCIFGRMFQPTAIYVETLEKCMYLGTIDSESTVIKDSCFGGFHVVSLSACGVCLLYSAQPKFEGLRGNARREITVCWLSGAASFFNVNIVFLEHIYIYILNLRNIEAPEYLPLFLRWNFLCFFC